MSLPAAMTSPDTMVQLENVGVQFADITALRNIDVQVRRGEFIALIGANGSGKTTLLHALHGLVTHTGLRQVASDAASQVMVFQRPFMLRLSVWNNLALALWLAAVPARLRAERSTQALQRAGLLELRGRPARALSGGQQQRLALARAWAIRPALLFLDEPTANLDPSARKAVESMLARFTASLIARAPN